MPQSSKCHRARQWAPACSNSVWLPKFLQWQPDTCIIETCFSRHCCIICQMTIGMTERNVTQCNFLGLAATAGGWKMSKPVSWLASLFLSLDHLHQIQFLVTTTEMVLKILTDSTFNHLTQPLALDNCLAFTHNESFRWYVIHVRAEITTREQCGVTIRLHLPGAYILLHTGFGIAGCFTASWQPTESHGTLQQTVKAICLIDINQELLVMWPITAVAP